MPPKGQADLAHPQAADWVMGTLGPDDAIGFRLHLRDCPHCQAAVAEFDQVGQKVRHLPPSAEPPPGLEARVIAAVLAAAAQDRGPTAGEPESPTQVVPILAPAGQPETLEQQRGGGTAKVVRFPRWHGRAGLFAVAGLAAAVIIAAVVILPGLGGSLPAGSLSFALSSPSGATGSVTARPDPSGSWDITLTVNHLRNLGDVPFYECWYLSPGQPGHQLVVSAGTFVVGNAGTGTFSLTSAVDPHQYPVMEIVAESPGPDGALHGTVVLTGRVPL